MRRRRAAQRLTVPVVTVDEAAARAWFNEATEGREVSAQGHNSVVVMLAGGADWLIAPSAHMVQTSPVSEALPFGSFTDRFPVLGGNPLVGDSWRRIPRSWYRGRWRPESQPEDVVDRRRLVGAIGFCLQTLRREGEAGVGVAGIWWGPLLIAGTVIAVAGLAAYAVRSGLTEATRIHEVQATARSVAVVQTMVDAYRDRLQVFRSTGRMPPASEIERSGLAQVGAMSDRFWETFAERVSTGAGTILVVLGGAWILVEALKSRPGRVAQGAAS